MTGYRIVCVIREHPHRHITDVGIGSDAGWNEMWTVGRAREAIRSGDRLYTISRSTRAEAEVRVSGCDIDGCTVHTLRSLTDTFADNNLNNLQTCSISR
jgi:hypothetical protein